MTMNDERACPRCAGTGETGPLLACGPGTSQWIDKAPCWLCKGAKTIGSEQAKHLEIGKRVRAKRIERGITQADLAAYLSMDRVAYSQAESLGVGDARDFARMLDWLETAP